MNHYLKVQEQLITEIMERQGVDFLDALDIARLVMGMEDI